MTSDQITISLLQLDYLLFRAKHLGYSKCGGPSFVRKVEMSEALESQTQESRKNCRLLFQCLVVNGAELEDA